MKNKSINNRQVNNISRGFTIIEIMIVLAIAGFILLIIFLALPTLQRTARNHERAHDAYRISQAIQQCLNNNNNDWTVCGDPTKLDISNLSILQGALWGSSNPPYKSGGKPVTPTINKANYLYNLQCNSTGNWFGPPVSGAFAVSYQIEADNSGGVNYKCIDGG